MMDFGEEVVSEMCGLDYSLLEEASLNDAMMNVHARVLYIAKVKDIADVDTVKEAFQKRLDLLQQTFETYLPDQYELAKARPDREQRQVRDARRLHGFAGGRGPLQRDPGRSRGCGLRRTAGNPMGSGAVPLLISRKKWKGGRAWSFRA